ncbi:MAG: Arm DNA-binding domain-containing protein [Caulobacteraceae bacterium]
MAQSKLTTDRQIAALKPRDRPYETAIAGARGLIVRTFPSGLRSFELRYVTISGVRRRLPLGEYQGIGLAEAVKLALVYGVAIMAGQDPVAEKAAAKHKARTGDTLTELAAAYFKAAEKGLHGGRGRPKRPSTLKVERVRFDVRIKPELGASVSRRSPARTGGSSCARWPRRAAWRLTRFRASAARSAPSWRLPSMRNE